MACLTLQHRIVGARMRVCLSDWLFLADIPTAIVFLFRRPAWIAYVYMKADEGTTQVWN
jgi:hypothetical protein